MFCGDCVDVGLEDDELCGSALQPAQKKVHAIIMAKLSTSLGSFFALPSSKIKAGFARNMLSLGKNLGDQGFKSVRKL